MIVYSGASLFATNMIPSACKKKRGQRWGMKPFKAVISKHVCCDGQHLNLTKSDGDSKTTDFC